MKSCGVLAATIIDIDRQQLTSSSSHSPSGVSTPALNGGWRSKARATMSASPGEMLARLRRLRAVGPRRLVRPRASARNWTTRASASADAVPPDSALGASSRGGAVTCDTGGRTAGIADGEPPAPRRGGALDCWRARGADACVRCHSHRRNGQSSLPWILRY